MAHYGILQPYTRAITDFFDHPSTSVHDRSSFLESLSDKEKECLSKLLNLDSKAIIDDGPARQSSIELGQRFFTEVKQVKKTELIDSHADAEIADITSSRSATKFIEILLASVWLTGDDTHPLANALNRAWDGVGDEISCWRKPDEEYLAAKNQGIADQMLGNSS